MLRLYKNYPYDSTYDYVKMFTSQQQQSTYFNNLNFDEYDKDYYIRTNTNNFTIELSYEEMELNGYNYLSYNNDGKTYYCFINTLEYNSQYRTRIVFQIDVLQTYMFDISLEKSFIERKVCSIGELTNYDEGLDIGEHEIVSDTVMLEKTSVNFAMFNGFKEQEIIMDGTNIKNVVDLGYHSSSPTTTIDGIAYPLYFMPLKETYSLPGMEEVGTGGVTGDMTNGEISRDGFRFVKGYEAFGPYAYDDGYGYMTIAYGITQHGEYDIYNELVAKQPVSETEGAMISYQLKRDRYGKEILPYLSELGVTKQREFDALVSLAYNCGTGVVSDTSNDLMMAIKSKDRNLIREVWKKFYITSGGIVSEGLILRREAEASIFLDGIYNFRDIPLLNEDGRIIGTITENDGNGWLPS